MLKITKKILLIEDDLDIHQYVKAVIESTAIPAKLVSMYTVKPALDYLERHRVDLVLLDLSLSVPNDGARLIIELSKQQRLGKYVPPVVILSAEKNGSVIDYVEEFGAIQYLQKPLDAMQLYKAIQAGMNAPKEAFILRFNSECAKIG